ncbi:MULTISPECIES: magnesium-translocating P-type ATPase [unclassified Sphingobium]|uniref:magnesium-translocating P-type ATPase n=1 Tax=unclassified Sphingobium TaxID=2611147 RepID=UPI00044F5BEF|nr:MULTISPECIES: magnesium-translocating P-type ATPase [unclassified Sphingobium]EXS70501.1 metal ABC transporter ATPase [Sphingobium sp. Ant17]WCP12145.1 Magnesium-transporting ATPase, P-type 1 [Sphingobium sp. AntQ-1]
MTEPQAFWQATPDDSLRTLAATCDGLSSNEAAARLDRDGPNEISAAKQRHLLLDLLRRLGNPLIAILLVAAGIAGATGDMASFAIIFLVVVLSTTLDLVQEHRAEATAEALKRAIALHATVLRDGKPIELPVRELVAGDIVMLAAGDLVPADGVVLAANGAQVNEALLTGEPYPVEKQIEPVMVAETPADARNALFHGTSLIGGTATMLVVQTGLRTRFGAIARSLAGKQPTTAFEHGIHKLGVLIVRLTIFLVLFVLLAHLALGRPPLQSFLFAMALAVGLTPELLPMIMTVALGRGAQRMAKAKVVVKRLSAIHDLGQMDILCTDKTGTLTEARITLVGHPGIDGEDDERVAELAAVNARFETGLKSPLDQALLLHMTGRSLEGWRKLDERPFDFERRRVAVLAEQGSERIEIVKGAPETLLALCTRAQDRSGEFVPLDDALRARLCALRDDRAAQGLRLLAIAWKPAAGQERIDARGEDELVFAGYCVFVDPPKPSATSAVARLEAAGIRIKVISGDAAPVIQHLVAALALPVEGILTGEEIAKLNDPALAARVEQVDLFARVTPDQKTRIVRALRARGHTVGFIGDGINDAPAIRAADVGLSVDGATDVAREAADMILLAPDLGVLADGVAEGRRTYANIMKYVRMGTSSNFGNMLTMAIASLFLPFLPLTPVQVLLNNLLYDLSEIGIPFDTADSGDLARPQGWDIRGLVRFTAIMGPLSSLFDFATFALLLGVFHVGIPEFRTAWFMESMMTQILVVFVIRTSRPAWSSRPHIVLTVTALAGLAAALLLPLLPSAGLLGFAIPGATIFGAIALLVAGYLASAEFLKRFALRPARSAR